MAGQESRVPPILDPQTDMVLQVEQEATKQEKAGLARLPPSEIIAAQNLMTTFQIILYAIKTIFQSLTQPPWEERLIYLPHNVATPLLTSIKEKANLASPPFISTGDALTAWFTKLTASFSPSPISLIPFVNIRYQFPSLLPTTKLQGVHLQNMLVYLHARLTGTLAKDVPDIVAHWKRQTVQQREQQQLVAFIRKLKEEIYPGTPFLHIPGETGDTRILVNNLINMDLVKLVNFKPAVVKQGDLSAGRENPLGGMVCFMTYRYVRQFHTGVHMFQMLGSDHSGGHYMFATMQKERWAGVERELSRETCKGIPGEMRYCLDLHGLYTVFLLGIIIAFSSRYQFDFQARLSCYSLFVPINATSARPVRLLPFIVPMPCPA